MGVERAKCRMVATLWFEVQMPIITLETRINAPRERVFDLARSLDLHLDSMSRYDERIVSGRVSGLIEMGESVTWEARHFGVSQRLTSRITAFERPRHFRDSLVRGAFKRFDHDHEFAVDGAQTRMTDLFDYDSPWGVLGRFADWLAVESHVRAMLEDRNGLIKRVAQSDEWRALVPK